MIEQAQKLTLSSRAFYNSVFGQYAKKVTEMFGFDMVLPMNTGAEAVETAIKLSRKWAYEKKGVPEGKAIVFSVEGNFHGRTLGVIRLAPRPAQSWIPSDTHHISVMLQHEYRPREPRRLWTLFGRCWSCL